jgi:beta-carotene hydroxylase
LPLAKPRLKRQGALRYRADAWPIRIALATTGLSLVPLVWAMPLWLAVAWWIGVTYLRTFCAFAQHNHAHLPVFRRRLLNRLHDAVLTQSTGYPTALWELHHNRGHHRHFLRPDDDVASIFYKGTRTAMPRWLYALRGIFTVHRDAIRIGLAERRAGRKSLLPKLALELLAQTAITLALLAYRPGLTIAFVVVPNVLVSWMVWWESYPHHLDLPMTGTYDAAITIENQAYNFLTFNIGHHAAHHQKPTLHWSLLPALTAKIRPLLHELSVRPDYATAGTRWRTGKLRRQSRVQSTAATTSSTPPK